MKNRLIYSLLLLFAATAFFACEEQTTPDPVRIQNPMDQAPILRDDAYFARLREYKKSDHKLAFGWFGSWSAIEASEQCRLRSAPDSMDIISMWSQWHSLTPAQIEDKAYVQQIKGTKVVICISARDVPTEFKEFIEGGPEHGITDASLAAYAKAWGLDSMEKYQYDGIDIDFETAVDHLGPLNKTPGLFKKFCEQLSQYIGPKSSTGRLFLIDGNVNRLDKGIAELCTYAVSQAYNCDGPVDLSGRTGAAGYVGWLPEQMIFTENFESLWKNGGWTYIDYDGTQMPSLLGMALYSTQSPARGFGAYHMEYEYGHADMPYKYMRRAIQLANPAPKGDYSKNLVSLNQTGEKKTSALFTPSGIAISSDDKVELTAKLSQTPASDIDIPFMVDNSLADAYNDYHFTSYKTLDPALVKFSSSLHFPAGSQKSEGVVTLGFSETMAGLPDGEYLIPVVIDCSGNKKFAVDENKKVLYVIANKGIVKIGLAFPNAEQLTDVYVTLNSQGTVIDGKPESSLSAELTMAAPAKVDFRLVVDQSLVAKYNATNGTDYKAIAAGDIKLSSNTIGFAVDEKISTPVLVSVADLSKLPDKLSMIAVRLEATGMEDYTLAPKDAVKYILIHRVTTNIISNVTAVEGTVIADRSGWAYTAPGALSLNSAAMFDGVTSNQDMGWYSQGDIVATVDMAKSQKIAGYRMSPIFGMDGYAVKRLFDIETSEDGTTWTDQSLDLPYVQIGAYTDGWQYVKFIVPVTCRYIRMTYKVGDSNVSNGFAGCNEFEAIASNN